MSGGFTGEVSFTALGRNWPIRYDINTISRIEDKLDRGFGEIGKGILQGRLGFIRAVLWGGMVETDPKLTELQVGLAMKEIGLEKAGELVLGAMQAAFPEVFGEPETGDAETPPADPPPPAG